MKQELERLFMIWSISLSDKIFIDKIPIHIPKYSIEKIPLPGLDYERTFHNTKKPHVRLHFDLMNFIFFLINFNSVTLFFFLKPF